MRVCSYREELGGVVLSYSDVELMGRDAPVLTAEQRLALTKSGSVPIKTERTSKERMGMIFLSRPHIHLNVRAKFLVFAPAADQPLIGVVNKVSDDTVGLVCYGVFNVSIAKSELPINVCRLLLPVLPCLCPALNPSHELTD